MSYTPILYVIPTQAKSKEPTVDDLLRKTGNTFSATTVVATWRGWRTCVCGERSTNSDYALPDGTQLNSLACHYMKWHRNEVPETDLEHIRNLVIPSSDDNSQGSQLDSVFQHQKAITSASHIGR